MDKNLTCAYLDTNVNILIDIVIFVSEKEGGSRGLPVSVSVY